jgi:hypothetical protein
VVAAEQEEALTRPEPIPPQPQPVVDTAQRIGQLVFGAFTAVGIAWFLLSGGISMDNIRVVGAAVGAAVTALIGLGAYLWSLRKAHQVAAQVTPLASPRNGAGEPLKTSGEWAASYGKHGSSGSGSTSQVTANIYPTGEDNQFTGRFSTALTGGRAEISPRGSRLVDAYVAGAQPGSLRGVVPSGGIHGHPEKKLGKLPPIPGRAAVPFRDFVKVVPEHPIADPVPQLVYPIYRNDQAGDCVAAAIPHTFQTICAQLGLPWTDWTDDQVLKLYQTQNPGFRSWADAGGPNDGGMVIQTCLEYLIAQGEILAFGKIDHTDPEEMRAAIYLGLAIVTGETLDVAQQTQTVWSFHKSAEWGGHCTCTVGYPGSTRQTCVTWGELVDMTESFIAHQLDEAWFVLTQAHVDHAAFRQHFDLAGFAAAVSQITGGKVVVPVPAPQPPSPGPAPAPGPAPGPPPSPAGPPADVLAAADELAAWVLKRKGLPKEAVADAKKWQAWEAGQ